MIDYIPRLNGFSRVHSNGSLMRLLWQRQRGTMLCPLSGNSSLRPVYNMVTLAYIQLWFASFPSQVLFVLRDRAFEELETAAIEAGKVGPGKGPQDV